MSERIITDCDRCKRKDVPTRPFRLPVREQIDPPSGRTETVHKRVDLCFDCTAAEFSLSVIDKMDLPTGQLLIREWEVK